MNLGTPVMDLWAPRVLIARMAKALVPQHLASPILNGKDRDFEEGRVNRIVAVCIVVVVSVAVCIVVVISVDVGVAVFEMPVLK